MKFVFVSNYLNHHQIPFCRVMYELLEGSFAFVQTEPMEEERIRMGWQEKLKEPYLEFYYEEPERCRRMIEDAAAVLFGGTDEESYIQGRLSSGKPLIRYSERLYKEGQWKAVSPRGLLQKYRDHTRYRKEPVYMLCAGAYVPSDFRIVRAYPGKLLRWGYFPQTRQYDVERLMQEKEPGSILWAARFLDWKHPELPLRTAKYLLDRGVDFKMRIAGGGELEEKAARMLAEYGLSKQVSLLGYRTPEQIRSLMEKTEIYLVTSDRREGWGAVVNEAMNSGCAVVADHMLGAAPFLIHHGENGFVYRDGRPRQLFELTEQLLTDRSLCRRLGENAVKTITEQWNAENAAKRLLGLCLNCGFLMKEELPEAVWEPAEPRAGGSRASVCRAGSCPVTECATGVEMPAEGPCSPAPVIAERRMYSWLMKNR